jgi:CO dehydrogenase maturation factor
MAFRLAVAGKGGTGKTTVCGLAVRSLVDRDKGAVLAVDADPNASLGLILGMDAETTLAQVRENSNKMNRLEMTGVSKHAAAEFALQTAVTEGNGVDMITMGRPEGPGCYCYVNNMLRDFLENLTDSYPWVVLDNEAGMEHLSRRTTNNIDLLMVVFEPTVIGITTASRLIGLTNGLPISIGRTVFVANRVPTTGLSDEPQSRMAEAGVTPDLLVPADEVIYAASAEGRTVFDLPDDCTALGVVRDAIGTWVEADTRV